VVTASAVSAAGDTYSDYLNAAYPADGPGATAIVVKDGEVLFQGARGMADLELGVPLTPDHVLRLGSITKQFTAAAIMLLEQQGKLTVGDSITKYLPGYPINGYEITIEHLLTHTSGIFSYTSIPGYMVGNEIRADLSTEELVDVFDDLEMDFSPGEQWSYSNSGYVVLGAIIEKVSGQSYADFVKDNIFEPLGMNNSHYGGSQLIPGRASGYQAIEDGYTNAPFLSMTQPHAAGSLLSTVGDLARWNAGLFGGELLTEESVARMTTEFTLNDGEGTGYGYGLSVREIDGTPVIDHGGGIHGFATYALWMPEAKIYVALLCNNPDNLTGPNYVVRQMAAKATGNPLPTRTAIDLDGETLDEYVGVYTISETQSRSVTVEDDRLYTQRTGSMRMHAFAHAEDTFFYERNFSHFTFERDAEGRVARMLMYQGGAEEPEVAERTSDVVQTADDRPVAEVSPELYDLWAGTYELQPGFNLTVTREGDRLMSQATGQEIVELHPTSVTRYFITEVEAEIEFVPGYDGRALELVLYQGGQELKAARVD
jgi:CubicO group peptidase (beta-lactamase class C family)